ncbi:MAG: hypothetical protein PHI95_02300 [Bacteroidales bacterium]|nr:hypothetical protein [Bacteroidales bacterium]HNW48811.1 hypothetical protein [Bacteroidales bacterium]HPS96229.1 hypothetical protein [Bacteroidales bacterium]
MNKSKLINAIIAAVLCSLLVVFIVPQRQDRSVANVNGSGAAGSGEYSISVSSQMSALSQQAQNGGVNFAQQARAVGGSASTNLLAKIRGYSIIRERLLSVDFISAPQNIFELPGFNFSPNKRYFVFALREIII